MIHANLLSSLPSRPTRRFTYQPIQHPVMNIVMTRYATHDGDLEAGEPVSVGGSWLILILGINDRKDYGVAGPVTNEERSSIGAYPEYLGP